MNNDDYNTKLDSTEASHVSNMNSSVLNFTGPLPNNVIEKRTLPLLYVQSTPISKNTLFKSTSNASINISEDTSGHFNIPKLGAASTLSPNGTTKLVPVQSQNQNVAYVGTLFKSSTKGKDVVPQKVLLTPVKGKEVSMARLILPRPPISAQSKASPPKQVCRSFVASTISQNALVTSAITVKTPEVGSNVIQPSIIRPRNVEAKVLTPGAVLSGGIIVPDKNSVPPPTPHVHSSLCTRCYTVQHPSMEKPGLKVVLLDMKEHEMKKHCTELTNTDVVPEPMKDSSLKLPDKSVQTACLHKMSLEYLPQENLEKKSTFNQHNTDIPKNSQCSETIEVKSSSINKIKKPSLEDHRISSVPLSMPLLDAEPPDSCSQGKYHTRSDSHESLAHNTLENSTFISSSTKTSPNNIPIASNNVSISNSSNTLNDFPSSVPTVTTSLLSTNNCNNITYTTRTSAVLTSSPIPVLPSANLNNSLISNIKDSVLPKFVTKTCSNTVSINSRNIISFQPSKQSNPISVTKSSLLSNFPPPVSTNISVNAFGINTPSCADTKESFNCITTNVNTSVNNTISVTTTSDTPSVSSSSTVSTNGIHCDGSKDTFTSVEPLSSSSHKEINNPSTCLVESNVLAANKALNDASCVSLKESQSCSTKVPSSTVDSNISLNNPSKSTSSIVSHSITTVLDNESSPTTVISAFPSSKIPPPVSSQPTSSSINSASVSSFTIPINTSLSSSTQDTGKLVPSISITPQATPSSTGERARKRKGSLSASVPSPFKTLILGDNFENLKLFPGAEEIDPFKVFNWDDQGLGRLPESEIKVIINDFNMLDIYDSDRLKEDNNNDSTYKKDQTDEIYCCVACRCYGLLTEFFNENYCSISCRDELIAQQYAIITKKEPELEMLDKEKKKSTPESVPNKNISKPQVKHQSSDDINDNIYEKDIELDECSSTDAEFTPKKNDDLRSNKVKKLTAKSSKIPARKIEKLTKSNNFQTNESKNKIKLRPRIAGKISKPAATQENIVQDLDVGACLSNEKLDCTRNQIFRWSSYLAETKASPAWVKLFARPYPTKPNRFKVGHKLEAIDPEHQSYFCLVTIADVRGHRIKLHFDGYPPDYDFWLNADSPNIFPSEFCNSHNIPFHPPPGQASKTFDWNAYLTRNNAKAAPASCFENHLVNTLQTNLFRVDMKLEAVDRKNTYLVCVATVAAVMENRILIHFDSWGDLYDYWVDISSPYIRPVGWCKNNNHELTPPNGIKSDNFSWKKYLKETKSIAAPEKAFTLRPPIEFKKGMKIEVIDKRAPHLLRVATISEVLPYQVKVVFDGFPPHFGYWVDDDSPDIHPVGWASRTGHPLEPPPIPEDFKNVLCPTPGCIGQGFLNGTKDMVHSDIKNCPYATENLGKDTALTDRLKWTKSKRNGTNNIFENESEEESDEDIESIRWSWLKVKQDENKNKIEREEEKNESTTGVSVNDLEESKVFEPFSPLPFNELQEIECSVDIKTESESIENEVLGNSDKDVKSKNDLELNISLTTKKETPEESMCPLNVNNSLKSTISLLPLHAPVKKETEKYFMHDAVLKEELITNEFSDSINMKKDEAAQNTLHISVKCKKKALTAPYNIKNVHCSIEKTDVFNGAEDKLKLEEKNVLFWTIHQVSQFTRPLISCADDCFLKEGIDGAGFLMLSKNDLLDYLGLSDNDAERVFRKINMLRKKCVLS